MPNDVEIEDLLNQLKFKLEFFGYEFSRERRENKETMKQLGLSMLNVKRILSELTPENYSEGPVKDAEEGGFYWVFGTEIDNKEIYIKINLGKENRKVICYSFHFAKSKMNFPKK